MEMPFSGTLEAEVEVVEGVFEGLSSDSVGLEVVSLPESDTLVVQPLSMLGPLLADTSSVEKPSIEFYQNPPSDWVLDHMKAIGSLVGASYEGYEDEVIALLQKIESGRPQASDRTPKQARGSHSARGQRELRGLQSSVNYETHSASRRTMRDREMILSL
jgi:hypothetical protein